MERAERRGVEKLASELAAIRAATKRGTRLVASAAAAAAAAAAAREGGGGGGGDDDGTATESSSMSFVLQSLGLD
jgi:hypothetical protein